MICSINLFVFRGIPYFSKDRGIRMEAIGKFFAENNNFDVISLQEVWTEHDYELLRQAAEKNLPYSHYFHRYTNLIKIRFNCSKSNFESQNSLI